jgi:bacillopeptidase F
MKVARTVWTLAKSERIARDEEFTTYFEDFEDDNGGYTSTGDWQYGTPVTWPGDAASGSYCWGTNLNGNYSPWTYSTLRSPEIDMSGIENGATVQISWKQALHIEPAIWDDAIAYFSVDGGTTWTTIWIHSESTVQTDWTEHTYTIPSFTGENIELMWLLTDDGIIQYSGLYVDDVYVTEIN